MNSINVKSGVKRFTNSPFNTLNFICHRRSVKEKTYKTHCGYKWTCDLWVNVTASHLWTIWLSSGLVLSFERSGSGDGECACLVDYWLPPQNILFMFSFYYACARTRSWFYSGAFELKSRSFDPFLHQRIAKKIWVFAKVRLRVNKILILRTRRLTLNSFIVYFLASNFFTVFLYDFRFIHDDYGYFGYDIRYFIFYKHKSVFEYCVGQ